MSQQQEPLSVAKQSVQSLYIEMYFNDQILGSGTAFVVQGSKRPLLLTNRHNVTGRKQDNGQTISPTGGVPNKIAVTHNRSSLGTWGVVTYPLYGDDGSPAWREHPTLGPKADFVALPFDDRPELALYPHDVEAPPAFPIGPADTVSVIGFPFGRASAGKLAIWATGFVASDMDFDHDNLPLFLIDCRARPGQSGSPVLAVRSAGTFVHRGNSMTMGGHQLPSLASIPAASTNSPI